MSALKELTSSGVAPVNFNSHAKYITKLKTTAKLLEKVKNATPISSKRAHKRNKTLLENNVR